MTGQDHSNMEILGMIIMAAQLVMQWYDASLMRAIFSLAFHTCKCIEEMVSFNGQLQHAVQAQNVQLGESRIYVTFTFFKHHRRNTPETMGLSGEAVMKLCQIETRDMDLTLVHLAISNSS